MRVCVIGGGAAGMMCATMIARKGHSVTLLEQNEKLGKKIYITGKGRCNVTNVAVGVLVGELLTHGVTAFLTKKGIMDGAMGLMGLGKLGIDFAPVAWQALTGAAGALAAWSPLLVTAGITFAAVKAIPMIRNVVDAVKKKHKEAHAFDANMQKLIAEQKEMEEGA